MDYTRRKYLKQLSLLSFALTTYPTSKLFASAKNMAKESQILPESALGNFKYIYGSEKYRSEFFPFLVNVFNLYPEQKFHKLITQTTQDKQEDAKIYLSLRDKIKEIKPFLSELTYAVPALNKQKKIIAEQTLQLLPSINRINGYLEVGSTGRYLDEIEEHLKIRGDIYLIDSQPASFSPESIIDRGQIKEAGKFIPLNNYDTNIIKHIPKNSLDLVTVYIGFHHCPPNLREEFITSIRDVLKPNGKLIVRDHDAHNEKMNRVVALAHDVFNLGTNETWEYNEKEERYFYSLAFLDEMLNKYGFKTNGKRILQDGDPTLNSLMLYTKA